jgi:hydrogenase-4 component E
MPDIALIQHLNLLVAGLFLLVTLGLVATRQVLASNRIFVIQSFLLAISAVLVGYVYGSPHLYAVAGITVVTKVFLIPLFLRKRLGPDLHARREVEMSVGIPSALLVALGLTGFAYFVVQPLLPSASADIAANMPVGTAVLVVGAYAILVRREALPQLMGLLAMENGAFFAGISIAPDLPMIAELAAAFDVIIIAVVLGLLTKKIHERVGHTTVGDLTELKEGEV